MYEYDKVYICFGTGKALREDKEEGLKGVLL